MMDIYRFSFDDPYKILAHYIVGHYRPADVLRILTDSAYIKNCVLKEVRQLDIGGPYLDCIIESVLEERSRMEYMHKLDQLSEYYYSKLDKERLRSEIRSILESAGIEIFIDYSTGGNDSSAST